MEELATKSLSNVEDVDMAQAMIDFTTQSTAYQAALKAGANIVQPVSDGLPALVHPVVPPSHRTCPPHAITVTSPRFGRSRSPTTS